MSRPISDYAIIGDCETAALVARDGSIDWLCWPRFDSGACFAALLGTPEHGRWRIAPREGRPRIRRRYRGDTLVLETEFETDGGVVAVIDFMPLRSDPKVSELVRIVVGRRGRVDMRMDLGFRFDYGRILPWVSRTADGRLRAVAGPHAVFLDAPVDIDADDHATVARFSVAGGERLRFVLAYEASHLPPPEPCDPETALRDTEGYWSEWSERCRYRGPWEEAGGRSLVS